MPDTKKCEACGEEIASSEEKCPKCGVIFTDLDEEVSIVDRALRIRDARKAKETPSTPEPTPAPAPVKRSIFRSLGGK